MPWDDDEKKGMAPKGGRSLGDILNALKGLDVKDSGETEVRCKICDHRISKTDSRCPNCGTIFSAEGTEEGVLPVGDLSAQEEAPRAVVHVQEEVPEPEPEPEPGPEHIPETEPEIIPEIDEEQEPEPEPAIMVEHHVIEEEALTIEYGPVVQEHDTTPIEMEEVPEVTETSLTNGRIRIETVSEVELRTKVSKDRGLLSTRGLVNGSSLINGNGMVNGIGLTNGNGMVNGRGPGGMAKAEGGPRKVRRRRARRMGGRLRTVAAAMVVVFLIFALPFTFMFMGPEEEGVLIDGDPSDWTGALMYEDGRDLTLAARDLDIIRYSAHIEKGRMLFYVQVAGELLSGSSYGASVDTVHVLIDTDGRSTTGYSIRDMGADAMIEVSGFKNRVQGKTLYKFDEARDGSDWNGWTDQGGVQAILKGNALEIGVSKEALGTSARTSPVVSFRVMDTRTGTGDDSEALITPGKGALVVSERGTCKGTIPLGTKDASFIELGLEAKGRRVVLDTVTITRTGNAVPRDLGIVTLRGDTVLGTGSFVGTSDQVTIQASMTLDPGREFLLDVLMDIGEAVPGHSVGLTVGTPDAVRTVDAVVAMGTVPSQRVAYLGGVPGRIVIDGAFADWAPVPSNRDPMADTADPDVDLVDTRATKMDDEVFFYMEVDGTMMAGTSSPRAEIMRPVPGPPGGGGPPGPAIPPPEVVGNDVLTVYIDADNIPLSGAHIHGLDFGADMALVVSGMDGTMVDKTLFRWIKKDREWAAVATFDAANDGTRMELGTDLETLGLTNLSTFGIYFHATDWKGTEDLSERVLEITDPLQLTADGDIYQSDDGNTWSYQTDVGDGTWVDMTIDSTGYAYVMINNGSVLRATGDWTSWTKVINGTADSNFVALATDSASPQRFFAIQSDGDAFNTTVMDWNTSGNVGGANIDYTDICYNFGTGNDTVLLAIRSDPEDRVRMTTDGGDIWGVFGNKDVSTDATDTDVTNVAIINATIWDADYTVILQSDGDIRYDTDGRASSPWPRNATPAVDTYVDMDFESSGKIWIVTSQGKTYRYDPSVGEGYGNWTTLGNTSETSVVAIGVNEIPEFEDLLIPLIGMMVLCVVVIRKRKRSSERHRHP